MDLLLSLYILLFTCDVSINDDWFIVAVIGEALFLPNQWEHWR